ncbi:hypothetical protein DPMN_096772 [Dreissena polymorpha]|uniref:Uncharacterized protein n=1 Tax=Dreissena polymorpha TaxID=45954 RepID=A0A9D4R4S9_DREPO|nr:hypothetical protein DPMN_096772 [Dreissena polymorpha]
MAVGGNVFSVNVNGLLTDMVANDGPSVREHLRQNVNLTLMAYRLTSVLKSVVLSIWVEPLNHLTLQLGLQTELEHVMAVGGNVFSVNVNGLLTDMVADDGPVREHICQNVNLTFFGPAVEQTRLGTITTQVIQPYLTGTLSISGMNRECKRFWVPIRREVVSIRSIRISIINIP